MVELQEHFLIDIKHEIVLYIGEQQDLEIHLKSIIDRCQAYGEKIAQEAKEVLKIVKTGGLDAWSIQYMKDNRRVPRRIAMRLKNPAKV